MTAVFNKNKRKQQQSSDDEPKNTRKAHNLFKLVLVGETSIGKTSLVRRFATDTFNERTTSTVNAEYTVCEVTRGGQPVRVQLWDTTGQECLRAIVPNFFRHADAILIVYDLTNIKSFENLQDWFDTVNRHAESGTRIYVIGTKCDLKHKRIVPFMRVDAYLQERGIRVILPTSSRPFETSAADGQGVQDSFGQIIDELLRLNQQDNIAAPVGGERALPKMKIQPPSSPPLPLWRRWCC